MKPVLIGDSFGANRPVGRRGLMQVVKRQSAALGAVLVAFIAQAIMVLTGVFLARLLGVENRGHIQLLIVIPLLLAQLGTSGLPSAMTFYIARGGGSADGALVRSMTRPLLALTAALLVVHAIILAVLLRSDSIALVAAGLVSMAAVPGLVALSLGLAILQGQQRFHEFNVLRAMQLVAYAIGLALLFASGIDSPFLVALIWTASTVVAGVYVLARAASHLSQEDATLPSRRELAWFGFRSVLGATSLLDAFRLDQLLVGIVVGPTALGLYVVGQAFTNLPRFVAQSIGMIAYPKVASAPDSARRLTLTYFILTLVICGGILAVLEVGAGRLVLLFFGDAFAASAPLMRILLFSALLFGLRRVLADCARGVGRPEFGMVAEIATWTTMVPALVVLAGGGATGFAWSMTIAAGVGFLVQAALLAWYELGTAPRERVEQPPAETVIADAV